MEEEPLVFDYVNHRGELLRYTGYPRGKALYQVSQWYPDDGAQWYMPFEVLRDGTVISRTFQLKRIVFVP